MHRSMPHYPYHHQLPEFAQTHVHQVGDVIQPSHPLLSPPPPALNLNCLLMLFSHYIHRPSNTVLLLKSEKSKTVTHGLYMYRQSLKLQPYSIANHFIKILLSLSQCYY